MSKKHQQVFVVTGAAGGIGRALCEKILKEGHYVFALDIRISSLQSIEENIDAAEKIRYGYAALDVTDEKAFADVLDSAQKKFGRVDCLINNAGVMSSGAFTDTTMAVWRKVIDINLMGVVYGTKAAVDIMREQGFGKIVNVASTAGVTPVLNATAYAASNLP
jgi:NADP-dependent 3-hydroxy acid dehydrogenase YdfG